MGHKGQVGIAGGIIVVLIVAGIAIANIKPLSMGTQAAAQPTVTPTASADNTSAANTSSQGYGPGRGYGRRGSGFGFARGGSYTVTSISGNTIMAKSRDGQSVTVTVTVTSSTTYTKDGQHATLSAVSPGDSIVVRPMPATNAATVTATSIAIVSPRVIGRVTGVSGSTITVTGFGSNTQTIDVTSSTRYQKGAMMPGGFGRPRTTTATPAPAALSDIKVGSFVMAEGTLSANGKTLTATLVTILPNNARFGRGPGGMPPFGRYHGTPRPHATGTPHSI